jgi:pyocin large subunit-like protein
VYDGSHSDSDEDDKNGSSDAQKMREAAAKLEENWEGRTFVSDKKFTEHYSRHSPEWSPKLTEEHYLAKARELLSAEPDANIEGFVSESGRYIYKYNNATNEFAIGRSNGVISTFYKPKTGRAYWLEERERNGGRHVFGGK